MTLAEFIQGRDNNFNLIRFIAAFAVLVTHSYAVVGLPPLSEPMRHLTGTSFGGMAVDAFFIISGFLVTGSLLSRKNAVAFLFARLLRIYPALIVVVLLTVFVLGISFTTLPVSEYLASPVTHDYLYRNMTLWTGIAFYLPGLFEDCNVKGGVNGSLWTLYFEVRMYAILLLSWAFIALVPLRFRERGVRYAILLIALVSFTMHFNNHYSGQAEMASRFYYMFFSGSLYYLLKDRVVLSKWAFGIAIGLLAVSTLDRQSFFVAYHLFYAYVILFLAYVPGGVVRKYNKVGDYSYGLYLYAFPMQQTVATFVPNISLAGMIGLSFLVTLPFAVLSWHLLEKRALGMKDRVVNTVQGGGLAMIQAIKYGVNDGRDRPGPRE